MNLIDEFRIALLTEFSLVVGLPNKRVLTLMSLFSVKIVASVRVILSKRVCLQLLKFAHWRKN